MPPRRVNSNRKALVTSSHVWYSRLIVAAGDIGLVFGCTNFKDTFNQNENTPSITNFPWPAIKTQLPFNFTKKTSLIAGNRL